MSRFLEPIYLNDRMVLNCAAYLFKGIPLESEQMDQRDLDLDAKVGVGIPFLKGLLTAEAQGGVGYDSMSLTRTKLQYTLGGLHMVALDSLREKKMLYAGSTERINDLLKSKESYVDVEAVLRPNDYFALITTLRSLTPLAAQIFKDFGDHVFRRVTQSEHRDSVAVNGNGSERGESEINTLKREAEHYVSAISQILDKLEADYLTSKQLEMVMYSKKHDKPMGVVELDMRDYEPQEMKAKLTGGEYHVIGKIIGRTGQQSSINLLDKTIVSQVLNLFDRVLSLDESAESNDRLRSEFARIRDKVENVLMLEIPGPAVRISAMSICI